MWHLTLYLLFPFFPALLASQIYDCEGTITNRPCPGGKLVLEEKQFTPPSPESVEKSTKQRWIHNLLMAQSRLKSEHGMDVNVSMAVDICQQASQAKCQEVVSEKEREINQLMASAVAAKSQAVPVEQEPSSGNQAVSVTVIEGDTYVVPQRATRPPFKPSMPQHRKPSKPKPKPKPERPRPPAAREGFGSQSP